MIEGNSECSKKFSNYYREESKRKRPIHVMCRASYSLKINSLKIIIHFLSNAAKVSITKAAQLSDPTTKNAMS